MGKKLGSKYSIKKGENGKEKERKRKYRGSMWKERAKWKR
jgi:hypothetical protein